jgi:hypothetical protein
MSFLNFGGSPKKGAPVDEEKDGENGEVMGVAQESGDLHVSQDGMVISDKAELEQILQQKRDREQP